jgi:hypothetical protein
LSVSTTELSKQRRHLAEPGEYLAAVEKAELTQSQRGNISVVLELRNAETGDAFDVRPLWIDGPNADKGSIASRNFGILVELLEAAGVHAGTYAALDDKVLSSLIGKTFDVNLSLEEGRTGAMFNMVVTVNGLIDAAGVDQPKNNNSPAA